MHVQAAIVSEEPHDMTTIGSPQSPAAATQQALHPPQIQSQAPSTVSTIPAESATDRQAVANKLQMLEAHKDWADKKIGQLIKRVTEAERPQKDEAFRLRDEVRNIAPCLHQLFGCFRHEVLQLIALGTEQEQSAASRNMSLQFQDCCWRALPWVSPTGMHFRICRSTAAVQQSWW